MKKVQERGMNGEDVWSGALKNRYDSQMLYNDVRWTDQRKQIYRKLIHGCLGLGVGAKINCK